MKNSHDISVPLKPACLGLNECDRKEIDNPDPYNWLRMMYRDRVMTVIGRIQARLPPSEGVLIADFGCAQGNTSLILAEMGYRVLAIDLLQDFLDYSRLKYERGNIEWIQGNVEDVELPVAEVDVAIVGELIEHCAYPEDVVKRVYTWLKPGGILVITTPNGSRIRSGLPTFGQFESREQRTALRSAQFRPDGDGHLFLFTLDDIRTILPAGAVAAEIGYSGSSILLWPRPVYLMLRLLPVRVIERLIRLMSRVPIINSKTFCNLCAIIEKPRARNC